MEVVEEIRAACARVAASARNVQVVEEAVAEYAQTLPAAVAAAPEPQTDGRLEDRAAYWLQLNAINFGSGWFPTLRKPPGLSGFRTVEAGLTRHGPWAADPLATIDVDEIAQALGQDPEHELMGLFARHLRELGERVLAEFDGSFLALARAATVRRSRWPNAWRAGPPSATSRPTTATGCRSSSVRRSPRRICICRASRPPTTSTA
jgi:hypothetical protein